MVKQVRQAQPRHEASSTASARSSSRSSTPTGSTCRVRRSSIPAWRRTTAEGRWVSSRSHSPTSRTASRSRTTRRHSYKRKNCRQVDGKTPTEAECSGADSSIGVDPNRNYGSFWGGPGAGITLDDETYRGASPFSEPEVANVRQSISTRQVKTMITNHTFTGLVLRPPGIKAQGPPPDEEVYKALGDAMARPTATSRRRGTSSTTRPGRPRTGRTTPPAASASRSRSGSANSIRRSSAAW